MYLVTCSVSVYLYVSSSPLSSSHTSAATIELAPARSRTSYYYHFLANHAPGIRTVSSHRPRISRVAIYCATVLCLFRTYSPISSNPSSCIPIFRGNYYKITSTCRFVCLPVICLDTLCWTPPRAWPMRGVITHVYDPKKSTACTTSFKNTPKPLDCTPNFQLSFPNGPIYHMTSRGYPPLTDNRCPMPLWSSPSIWRMLPSW